jgi:hypothetical protein
LDGVAVLPAVAEGLGVCVVEGYLGNCPFASPVCVAFGAFAANDDVAG